MIDIIAAKIAELVVSLVVSLGFAAVSTVFIEKMLCIRMAVDLLAAAAVFLLTNTSWALFSLISSFILRVVQLAFWVLLLSAYPAVAAGLAIAGMVSQIINRDLCLGALALFAVVVAASLGAPMLMYAVELVVANAALSSLVDCYSIVASLGYSAQCTKASYFVPPRGGGFASSPGFSPDFENPFGSVHSL